MLHLLWKPEPNSAQSLVAGHQSTALFWARRDAKDGLKDSSKGSNRVQIVVRKVN
jgi:hypothetical protein